MQPLYSESLVQGLLACLCADIPNGEHTGDVGAGTLICNNVSSRINLNLIFHQFGGMPGWRGVQKGVQSFDCIKMVVTMNPCPCGYYPDRTRCRCSEKEVLHYRGKISGAILDRIDLCITAGIPDVGTIHGSRGSIDSKTMQEKVMQAVKMQKQRFAGTKIRFNSGIPASEIKKYCHLESREEKFMDEVFVSANLSLRSYHKILKVARTIADLEESNTIENHHLSEALCYRLQEDNT